MPLASGPMIVVLLVAIFTVHLPNGSSSIKLLAYDGSGAHFGQPGYETDLLYLAALLALASEAQGRSRWMVMSAHAGVLMGACRRNLPPMLDRIEGGRLPASGPRRLTWRDVTDAGEPGPIVEGRGERSRGRVRRLPDDAPDGLIEAILAARRIVVFGWAGRACRCAVSPCACSIWGATSLSAAT